LPRSRSARDRAAFDAAFGPFWRTEMLIVRPGKVRHGGGGGEQADGQGAEAAFERGSVASPYLLHSLMQLQLEIEAIRVSCGETTVTAAVTATAAASRGERVAAGGGGSALSCEEGETWGLQELCFQPTPGAGCMVQSALEFWQMNTSRLLATSGVCLSFCDCLWLSLCLCLSLCSLCLCSLSLSLSHELSALCSLALGERMRVR